MKKIRMRDVIGKYCAALTDGAIQCEYCHGEVTALQDGFKCCAPFSDKGKTGDLVVDMQRLVVYRTKECIERNGVYLNGRVIRGHYGENDI